MRRLKHAAPILEAAIAIAVLAAVLGLENLIT